MSRRFRRGEPHILAARFGSVNTALRGFHLPLSLAANRFRRGEPHILAARFGSVNTPRRDLFVSAPVAANRVIRFRRGSRTL